MKQKIAIISLSTSKPMAINAIYEDHTLIMAKAVTLPSGMRKQVAKLTPYVLELRKQGFKVLVDETTGKVASQVGADHISLKARGGDGRPAVISGIERYFELRLQENIVLPPESGSAFEIPESIVDTEYNASGEEIYRINWRDILPEHVLTILCCFAVGYHNVATAEYMQAMDAAVVDKGQSLLDGLKTLIGYQSVKAAEAVPKSLAGKRISDEERIL